MLSTPACFSNESTSLSGSKFNFKLPDCALYAKSANLFCSIWTDMFNKSINWEALFASPTCSKAAVKAKFICWYALLRAPPEAADCAAVLERMPGSIITFDGSWSILRILPFLSKIFNSLKTWFNSVTAKIPSLDSSLLFNKPAPLYTFINLLITGSRTAVPLTAKIDLKPAELAISFTDCSLIPLNSWTPSWASSPPKPKRPTLVNKGSNWYPPSARSTPVNAGPIRGIPFVYFTPGILLIALTAFFDPAAISPIITPISSAKNS